MLSSSWVYRLSCVLRVLCLFSPGYIHPDEFFQGGQEVFASSILGLKEGLIPWEFQPQHALRCIVFPWLVSGLPVYLWRHMVESLVPQSGLTTSAVILYAPRLIMVALSFLQDWSLHKLLRHTGMDPSATWTAMVCLASSWPVLLFSSRPFSNTLEAIVLALVLATSQGAVLASFPRARLCLLGALLAVGTWVRFTFPAFALPVVLDLAWNVLRNDKEDEDGREGRRRGWAHQALRLWRHVVRDVAVGGGLTALFLITLDTMYYHGLAADASTVAGLPLLGRRVVVTPLNGVMYNSQSRNLSAHGLHPRITHALVNMPLLFLLPYLFLLIRLRQAGVKAKSHRLTRACLGCVTSGLAILSLAPHQEPRFLLPLALPLTLLLVLLDTDGQPTIQRTPWKILWVVHNAALLVFFGLLHQGGLTRMLSKLNQSLAGLSSPVTVVFHKTYMPPRFLLADTLMSSGSLTVLDLNDVSPSYLASALRNITITSPSSMWMLVGPGSIGLEGEGILPSSSVLVERLWPHLSTEDWPRLGPSCTVDRRPWAMIKCFVDQLALVGYGPNHFRPQKR